MKRLYTIAIYLGISTAAFAAATNEGVRRVSILNYTDCIELSNDATTVVLGHQAGGRVLKYEWSGEDALYLNPKEANWKPDQRTSTTPVSAGRFDIGPEYLIPNRRKLWSGEWTAEVIGSRAARLTSQKDESTGVQLIREFRLDEESSHLECKQVIKNISNEVKRWSHWSRTFAKHGGIAIVPLTPKLSRFPNHYIMYQESGIINFLPEDPNIEKSGDFLIIKGPPAFPKLGLDSHAGWFAYHMPNDRLFIKRYATYPSRAYGEIAALTISIWYPEKDRIPACELEPIGPTNEIAPGESVSFTEDWWLLPFLFPNDTDQLNLPMLNAIVGSMIGGSSN